MSARQPLAVLLAALAVLCGLVGGVSLYLREQVVDRPTFVDRARESLGEDAVRHAVTQEIAARLRANVPGAVFPPAQLDRAVATAVETPAFRRAFRRAAADANRVLFEDDGGSGEAALALDDLAPALARVDPRLAQLLPQGASTRLLEIRRDSLGVGSARIADETETLARVLPPLAAALLAAALLIASDRRGALRVAAIGAVLAGGFVLLALALGGSVAADQVEPGNGVTQQEARDAARDVWGVFTDGLRPWAIGAICVGLALTVATLVPWGRGAARPPRRAY